MLLWVLLLLVVALPLILGAWLAMRRAERRARRTFYRSLDIEEERIEALLKIPGDAAAQLAALRTGADAVAPAAGSGSPPPRVAPAGRNARRRISPGDGQSPVAGAAPSSDHGEPTGV